MSAESSAPAQPRAPWVRWLNRGLLWAGPIVLAVGVAVFVVSVFRDPTASKPVPTWTPPQPKRVPAKIDPAARRVAGKFILTAVARQNIASSWSIVHPELRKGYTKKEWAKGELPITPFPVASIDEARFRVAERFPGGMTLEVALIPKPGADVPATVFILGLRSVGQGADKRWLVDYWMPRWAPPIPDAP